MADAPRPRPAAAPEAVAAFYALHDKGLAAVLQGRVLRAAEYYGLAADAARNLWGTESLCVVQELLHQVAQLLKNSRRASHSEATRTCEEARLLVAECRRVLTARATAGSLAPGRCFEEEEASYNRMRVKLVEVGARRALSAAEEAALAECKAVIGFESCLECAQYTVILLFPIIQSAADQPLVPLAGEERAAALGFVYFCLEKWAQATHPSETEERELAELLRKLLAYQPRPAEQPLNAELGDLERRWSRPVLQASLRVRGALDTLDDSVYTAFNWAHTVEHLQKTQADEVLKHGLRWCALPSCAIQEVHVFDFKACSACKAVVYCSAEHGALHWARGHRKECPRLKAAGAKPRSTVNA